MNAQRLDLYQYLPIVAQSVGKKKGFTYVLVDDTTKLNFFLYTIDDAISGMISRLQRPHPRRIYIVACLLVGCCRLFAGCSFVVSLLFLGCLLVV